MTYTTCHPERVLCAKDLCNFAGRVNCIGPSRGKKRLAQDDKRGLAEMAK